MAYMDTGFKRSTSIHDRLATEISKCLQETDTSRMDDQRKESSDPKRPQKGTAPNDYKPIMCQPMMWKIQTAQIRKRFTIR